MSTPALILAALTAGVVAGGGIVGIAASRRTENITAERDRLLLQLAQQQGGTR